MRESADHGNENSWDRVPFLVTSANGSKSLVPAWNRNHHNFWLLPNFGSNIDHECAVSNLARIQPDRFRQPDTVRTVWSLFVTEQRRIRLLQRLVQRAARRWGLGQTFWPLPNGQR